MNSALFVWHCSVLALLEKTTYNMWADPTPASSFCPHLPFLLLCLFCSSKAFSSSIATVVWTPSPHSSQSPQHHHHHCCVTKEQKRECQTPPTRSLSHQSPHLSSRWGCLFFQGFSQPQESSKMEDPLPLEPTTQLPLIHLLHRHAPVARACPLSIPPQ